MRRSDFSRFHAKWETGFHFRTGEGSLSRRGGIFNRGGPQPRILCGVGFGQTACGRVPVRTGIPVAGTLAAQRFPKNRRGIKNRGGSFPGSEFPFSAFQSVFRNGCRDFGTKKSGSAVYKTGINAQATFVYIKHGRSRNGIPLLRACRSGGLLIAMLKVKFAVRLKGGIKWNSH